MTTTRGALCVGFLGVVLLGCEAPVTGTTVEGSVSGVSLPSPRAVSLVDKDFFGGVRRTVWVGSNLRCTDLRAQGLELGPSPVGTPDGGRAPLLIIGSGGFAYFDTGAGNQRLTGSVDRVWFEQAQGTLRGRYVTSFGDAGVDAGVMSGDFIAPPCASASGGCSAAPGPVLSGLLLLLALRRRARHS